MEKEKIEISNRDIKDLMQPVESGDDTFAGCKITFPNPAYPKQSEFCRMTIEGYGKEDIMAETKMSERLYFLYKKRFKPFIRKRMLDLKDMVRADNMLAIQQRINAKLKEIEADPTKDKTSLLKYLEASRKQMEETAIGKKSPDQMKPVLVIVDNRNKKEEIVDAEVRVNAETGGDSPVSTDGGQGGDIGKVSQDSDTVHTGGETQENKGTD